MNLEEFIEKQLFNREEVPIEEDKLSEIEVELYLNRFLCAFGHIGYEGSFLYRLLWRAYLTNRIEPCEWPLYDKFFYTQNITQDFVAGEIELFYSGANNRSWPESLKRLYYALYDAIRLCHFDTILDMQKNKWAVYDKPLHIINEYNIIEKDFNDVRIKHQLKAALPGLLARMVLINGVATTSVHCPTLHNEEKAPYGKIKLAQEIDVEKLYSPSYYFKHWYFDLNEYYQKNKKLKMDNCDRMASIYSAMNITRDEGDDFNTYLSMYYIGGTYFCPYELYERRNLFNTILTNTIHKDSFGKYSINSMVLNGIDPACNQSFLELMKLVSGGWEKCEINIDEQLMQSVLSFTHKDMDALLTKTDLDGINYGY